MNTKLAKILAGLGLLLLVLMLFGAQQTGYAAPSLQMTDFPTPTPGTDGRILYTVQAYDTLWRIAAVSGISLDELRQLNNLSADDLIAPGDVLLLGLSGDAVTPEAPTPESLSPPSPPIRSRHRLPGREPVKSVYSSITMKMVILSGRKKRLLWWEGRSVSQTVRDRSPSRKKPCPALQTLRWTRRESVLKN